MIIKTASIFNQRLRLKYQYPSPIFYSFARQPQSKFLFQTCPLNVVTFTELGTLRLQHSIYVGCRKQAILIIQNKNIFPTFP